MPAGDRDAPVGRCWSCRRRRRRPRRRRCHRVHLRRRLRRSPCRPPFAARDTRFKFHGFRYFGSSGRRDLQPLKRSRPAAKRSPLATLLAKKNRPFLIGAGAGLCVIAAILAASIFFLSTGRKDTFEAMRYLPSDCLVVATANVDELMRHPIYKQLEASQPNFESNEREAEQNMGFSFSDVSRVTIAVGGKRTSLARCGYGSACPFEEAHERRGNLFQHEGQPAPERFQVRNVTIGGVTVFEETLPLCSFCRQSRAHAWNRVLHARKHAGSEGIETERFAGHPRTRPLPRVLRRVEEHHERGRFL